MIYGENNKTEQDNHDFQYYHDPNQFDFSIEMNKSENSRILVENSNKNFQDEEDIKNI